MFTSPTTLYARMQQRRGLQIQLPAALEDAELGFAVDTGRLFIGNGQISEGAANVGNTEIITQYTLQSNPAALQYSYRSNTPVVATTGTIANQPVQRNLTSHLDDYVSVKDYGAVGNGIADDTARITQALRDLYTVPMPSPTDASQGYRCLYFPAGKYKISDIIYLPPNAYLRGDGITRSIIWQSNGTKTCVVDTADSAYQTGLNLGSASAVLPTDILVQNISLQHAADQDIVHISRAQRMRFQNCGFSGHVINGSAAAQTFAVTGTTEICTGTAAHGWIAGQPGVITTTGTLPTPLTTGSTYYIIPVNATSWTLAATQLLAFAGTSIALTGTTTGTAVFTPTASTSSAVYFNNWGSVYAPSDLQFTACEFSQTAYACNQDSNGSGANNINISLSSIHDCNWGIYSNAQAQNWSIFENNFYNIANTALYISPAGTGIASTGNAYANCGNATAAVVVMSASGTAASNACSSVNDRFFNNTGTNIINNGTLSLVIHNSGKLHWQNMIWLPPTVNATLTAGTNGTTGIAINTGTYANAFVDYVLSQGTGCTRIGTLSLAGNGTATALILGDAFTESSPSNVVFNYALASGTASITYTSTGTTASTLRYQIRYWSN